MKIGLSLSLCIKDIIEGRVLASEVYCIICGCLWTDPLQMADIYNSYVKSYWKADPDMARRVLTLFDAQGMIVMPKKRCAEAPNLSGGHWIDLAHDPESGCSTVSLSKGGR